MIIRRNRSERVLKIRPDYKFILNNIIRNTCHMP